MESGKAVVLLTVELTANYILKNSITKYSRPFAEHEKKTFYVQK